ncbi:DivIVA domain-containing protein [Nonomuraea basaltis]|uniref:DivIVA domain-containing protein n=1 Tax=Nonomuraea basaltis TaxID=2495887 RepID=UPI00110C563E|nr:DivIVA domain-containing protein [Nonomuraea basaltis]TMR89421.1 DivIVA domain-containing protein [Nonomuraea basaltis]
MDEPVEQGLSEFFEEPSQRYEFDVVMRGYDRHPVNELFNRIQKTFDGTADELERVTPDVIRATEFNVVIRGYHRRQVHEALLDCMRRLQAPA